MKYTWKKLDETPQTLKQFLKQKGLSHRILSRLKQGQGKVIVNRKKRKLDYEITTGEVTLILPIEQSDPNVAISSKPLEIIFEDSNWIVVNKPAGVNSVPGPSDRDHTMVNRIKYHLQNTGHKDLVPHVITRLDRDTSGLMLVAKNRFAQGLINKQVEEHLIQKDYVALIQGQTREHGFYTEALGPKPDGIGQMVQATGKNAKTEYWQLQTNEVLSVIRCRLHTGRTHQIRVHFSYHHHALLGDELYGGLMNQGIKRQALHSYHLAFIDPFQQVKKEFTIGLPQDMQNIIEANGISVNLR